jgi:hypothetical protein
LRTHGPYPGREFTNAVGTEAIAKAAIVRETEPGTGFAVLTAGLLAGPSGGRALNAVTGHDRPVAAVVEMLAADAIPKLAALH